MADRQYIFEFRKRLNEEETVVTQESDKDKIFRKSPKVVGVLTKLLSSQLEPNDKALKELQELISDIRVISFKPTTFEVIMKNTNFFDLIYDPAPMQTEYPEDYQDADSFIARVSGKKYKIGNKSEYEQCLDALNKVMRQSPIGIPQPADNEDTGEDLPGEDGEDVNAPDGNEDEDKNATDTKES